MLHHLKITSKAFSFQSKKPITSRQATKICRTAYNAKMQMAWREVQEASLKRIKDRGRPYSPSYQKKLLTEAAKALPMVVEITEANAKD